MNSNPTIANHGCDTRGIGGRKIKLHHVAWFKRKRRVNRHTAPAYFGDAAKNRACYPSIRNDDANREIDVVSLATTGIKG